MPRASAGRPTTSTCAAASTVPPRSRAPSSSACPTEELDDAVVGLVGGWVGARGDGETFRMFCDRLTDDELGRLAGREPAKAKEKA